jgi:hypothetical protein
VTKYGVNGILVDATESIIYPPAQPKVRHERISFSATFTRAVGHVYYPGLFGTIFILLRLSPFKYWYMDSLKRIYFSLAAGIAYLTRNKSTLEKIHGDMVVNRVSREVNHYRTHFFNV